MTTHSERIPDWKLERYLLGELPADELARIRAVVEQSPNEQARLETLRQSNGQLLEKLPPTELVAEVQRRAHLARVQEAVSAQTSSRWRPLWVAVPSALALVMALRLSPESSTGDFPTPAAGVSAEQAGGPDAESQFTDREKGLRPQLRLYRLRNKQVERVRAEQEARAGELLQVGYVAASRPYGMVLSVDGAGALTLHYPEEASGSTTLKTAGEVRLPHSFELDDAPEFERFFLVTSSQPFKPELVMEAARSLASSPTTARSGTLPLPAGLEQTSLLVRKVKP